MGKRANGEGTICERKSTGTWEAKITIGGKRRTFYGRTQAAVKEKLDKARAELRNNSFIEPSDMRVGEWLIKWVDTYTVHIKDSTRNEYRRIIDKYIIPRLGDSFMQKLCQDDIQRFVNDLFKSGRINKKEASSGLSARSVEFAHTILCSALSQAESLGHIAKNPAHKKLPNRSGGIQLPKTIKKEVEILKGDALNAFEDAVQNHEHKALYLTLLWSGLRRGEALALKWSDISNNTIKVNKQLQRERVKNGKLQIVPFTKNNKARTIPADYELLRILQEHKSVQSQKQLMAGALWEKNNLIFCNALGGMLDPGAVSQCFKRFLNKYNLPDIKLHALRHTAATEMLQSGDSPKDVQNTLGHHSAGYTMDTYTHITEEALRDSAARREAHRQNRRMIG